MKKVSLEKSVTIIEELKGGSYRISTMKHGELGQALINDSEIIAEYCFGHLKHRTRQLTNLGFKLKETIWFNDEALHSKIKEVWGR